tara:strand:+ start:1762 stop:2097 length:336 start_codon:yes stop_codon:yes gene_type:complete
MEDEQVEYYEQLVKEREEILPKRKDYNAKYERIREEILVLDVGEHSLKDHTVSIAEHGVTRYHGGETAVKILQNDDFLDEEMAREVVRRLRYYGVQRRMSVSKIPKDSKRA